MKDRTRHNVSKVPFRTASLYAAAGVLWILLSDRVLHALVEDAAWRHRLEVYKGWFFVLVTAGLLYGVLRLQLRRWEAEAAARRKALEALRLSEERFQLAMRGANDGVWDWSLEDDTVYLSPRYKEMIGYGPEELEHTLETWRKLVHPDDLPAAMERFNEFVAGKRDILENEFRMRHKDGHWKHILSRAFAIRQQDRIVRLVGTHVDLTERKTAEDEVRRKETMYRTAVNGVREVVFQSDPQGHWTFLNSAWERLTGFPVEQSLGEHFSKSVHPENRADDLLQAKRLVNREISFCDHLSRYLRRDGSFRWVEIHAQLVLDDSGAVLGIAGTLQDVTERRNGEEALRKSEEHLRHAATVGRVGTFEHDHLTDEFYGSPVFRELHGFTENEPITPTSLFARVHPDDATEFQKAVTRAHDPEGDGHFTATARWCLPNDQVRCLRAVSLTTFRGEGDARRPLRTVGASVDVTDNLRSEQALRDRETLYRAVIETSADGFLMMDLDGNILETNDAYIRRSGFAREELLAMNIADLEASETRGQVLEHIGRVRQNTYDLFETMHRARDGTEWQAEVDVSHWPIFGGRLFCFVRDLNQRKRSESLLRFRLELSELAENQPVEDVLRRSLDWIELFTSSRISCFHVVEPDQETHTLKACSSSTERLLPPGIARDRLELHAPAVLRRCLVTRLAAIENQIDEPSGPEAVADAIKLRRRLSVPVLRHGKVVAIVCVANRSTDYTSAEAGVVQEMSGILMDLVDRKQAEEALRESEQRLEISVAAAEIGHWEICLRTGTIKLSDSFEKLLACPAGRLPEKLWELRRQIHAEDRRRTERLLMESIRSNVPYDCEFRVLTPDGLVRWDVARGRVIRDQNGRASRFVGIAMDVTNRKLAEQAVARSEERYRAIVETTFDWIWEVDAEIRFTFSSPKVYDLLGYRPDEIIGKHYSELMTPESLARVQADGVRLTTPEKTFSMLEAECLHRDGRRVILESSGVPKRGPTGELLGYRGSSRNITERKLAEKERLALESQLRQAQKMEAIGTLAGGVAHDFNNILTVIHGNASLLMSRQTAHQDREECAQQIVRAAERAAGLTRQLLMFSRKQVMQLSNISLNAVVANMTKMLQRILGEDVTLQTTYGSNVGFIRGDVGMIEQILMNLSVNARDAMPEGGQLNIATGTELFSEREAEQHPDAAPGLHVWLSVKDTGTGIPPEILPHIFEPFFTTKEVGKGTGLGLATIYGIVRQHRGWITVATEMNQGTSFKIFFPALPGTATTPLAPPSSAELPKGTETILVVEDDPAVRDLMIQLLGHCGYRVLEASSGRAALDVWAKFRKEIQLLLTDLVMPDGITGLQLAERLRQETPGLRVLYVTGYSTELAAKGTPLVEGVTLLQKPFSPEKLARAVRTLLGKPKGPSGNPAA